VLEAPCVYANFVSSIDGVVALESGTAASGGIISGRNQADRFVMGLLRAFAEAVLVGAGTVRAEGGRALWTPEYIFPDAVEGYRALRARLKRSPEPLLVIVSARGDLDPSVQALQVGALVLTTKAAEAGLRSKLPTANRVIAVSDGDRVAPGEIMHALHAEGYHLILTEGGPTLFGQLVEASLVDELFLTVSPALAGQKNNFGLIHGVDFGKDLKRASLRSVRQHESHLFLRYRLKEAA
jgi:riboflavin biosynthesis pyrimidine reductase